MFWTIAGIVLAVVLIGAWIYDRKFGMDMTHRDQAKFNQAQGDGDVSRFINGSGNGI